MFDFNDPCLIVQMCKFQGYIQRSHIVIKFPCSYFVQWKTINNRYSICTQKRVRTANDQAIFNQKLTFYTEMVFNTKHKEYYSKQTFLVLNLVSKSRPDQVKLVGRVSVDLADVLNKRRYGQLTELKLNYCSVQGSICFNITLLSKRDSNLSVRDLDRSAFTDYFSINPLNRLMVEETISQGYMSNNQLGINNRGNISNQQQQSRQQPRQQHQQKQSSYSRNNTNSNERVSSLLKNNNNSNSNINNSDEYMNMNDDSLQSYKIPTFAQVNNSNNNNTTQQYNNNQPSYQKQHQQQFISIHEQQDQELISFQNNNSQKKSSQQHYHHHKSNRHNINQNDKHQNRTIRTESRQQSLIQRLQERNFGDRWGSQEHQKIGGDKELYRERQLKQRQRTNVVEISHKQSKTDRDNLTYQERQFEQYNDVQGNRYYEKRIELVNVNVNSNKSRTQIIKNLQEQVLEMNTNNLNNNTNNVRNSTKNHPSTFYKQSAQSQISPSNTNTNSNNNNIRQQKPLQQPPVIPLSKPTSPPSHSSYNNRQLTHNKSEQQLSQTSQYQNQKLLSIVQKLQQEKQQQQTMIQQLRSMVIGKSMKKHKQSKTQLIIKQQKQSNQEQNTNKIKQLTQQNIILNSKVQTLTKLLQTKSNQLSQKQHLIYKYTQKITILQNELSLQSQQVKRLQYKLQQSKKLQQKYKYMWQSMRLSVSGQLNNNEHNNNNKPQRINIENHRNNNFMDEQLMRKRSSKVLQVIRVNELLGANEGNTSITQFVSNPPSSFSEQSIVLKSTGLQRPLGQQQQEFKITITKDENIYQEMQKDNVQLMQRVKELEEENEIYKQLLRDQNNYGSNNNKNNNNIENNINYENNNPHNTSVVIQQQQLHQDTSPFTITFSKNNNIYQNYQTLEKQNQQLYKNVQALQTEILSYKQLLKQVNYPTNKKRESDIQIRESNHGEMYNSNGNIKTDDVEQPQTSNTNNNISNPNKQSTFLLNNMLSSLHNNKKQEQQKQQQQKQKQTQYLDLIGSAFKITLTKDKKIYQQQQEQNNQLSKRVIQLQDQIQKYKQLLSSQQAQHNGRYDATNNKSKQQNKRCKQQNRLVSKSSIQKQQKYQQQGFTIRLSKDKNIYQHQQQQLQQLNQQIIELQQKYNKTRQQLQRYISVYGDMNDNNIEYKISVTREENIYQDQQKEIKQLFLAIDGKDQQIEQLVGRLSMVEHQLDQYNQNINNNENNNNNDNDNKDDGQIMISIKRDENIYQQQQEDIKQMLQRVNELQKELKYKTKVIQQKDECIKEIQTEAILLRQRLEEIQRQFTIIPTTTVYSNRQQQKNTSNDNQLCGNCQQLSIKLTQLQLNSTLLQQQKTMLQQQITTLQQQISMLQQEKFCLNSTQNQLKIRVQQLEQQIYQISLENQKLNQQLIFVQENYHFNDNLYVQGEQQQYGEQLTGQITVNGNNNNNNSNNNNKNEQITFSPQNNLNLNLHLNISNSNKFVNKIHSQVERHPQNHLINSNQQLVENRNGTQSMHDNSNNNNKMSSTLMLGKILTPSVQGSQNVINTNFINNQNVNNDNLINDKKQSTQQCNIIAMLQQQNTSIKQSLSLFQQQIEQQQLTIGQLQQRISRLMYQKEILLQRQKDFNKEINQHKQQIQKQKQQLQKQQELLQKHKQQPNQQQQQQQQSRQSIERQSIIKQLQQQITHLQTQLTQQKTKTTSRVQSVLSNSRVQQSLLNKKQQQIQHLQKQLHQLNHSINQLSLSYHSLQTTFREFQKQKQIQVNKIQLKKQSQVQQIRQEHQWNNKHLKIELEQIENLIMEKQNRCQDNQQQLVRKQEQITRLIKQMNKLREEYNEIKVVLNKMTINNNQLRQQNNQLKQQIQFNQNQNQRKQHIDLQAVPKQQQQQHVRLGQMIESMKLNMSRKDIYVNELLPLIQNNLNTKEQQQQQIKTQQLSKLIIRQLQKIKLNIMKNHQSQQSSPLSSNGVIQRSTNNQRSTIDKRVDAKTFAQKSAFLIYLKPLEDLLKQY